MKRSGARLTLAGILAAAALLRLRFLEVPLERDEGEYAYLGQLILAGQTPYVAAHNMKLPGVYYAYAAILAVFGQSIAGIRAGLLAVNLFSVLLVHRLTTRLFGPAAGLCAAATFVLLSIGRPVQGFAANAEHFIVPPVLGALLLLSGDAAATWRRTAGAGFLLGVAYVMKQHALAFVAFGGLAVACAAGRSIEGNFAARRAAVLRHGAVFAAAVATPFALICLWMFACGAFEPFWFWTVTYASRYAAMIPFTLGVHELAVESTRMYVASPFLWLLAALGATALWWDAQGRRRRAFAGGFALFSFLALATGWRFTEHYFLLLMPAASVLVGAAVDAIARCAGDGRGRRATAVRWALMFAAASATLFEQRQYLFLLEPRELARSIYGMNPFPEAVEIARYLREHARPGDTLAVIGSEPQIYFYSRLPAATSYIYMYPLMEPHPFAHRMQEEMIAQLERALPSYLVLVNVNTSWSRRPESSLRIFKWAESAVNERYEPVGFVQMAPGRETVYLWGDDAKDAVPASEYHVTVFRRRT